MYLTFDLTEVCFSHLYLVYGFMLLTLDNGQWLYYYVLGTRMGAGAGIAINEYGDLGSR